MLANKLQPYVQILVLNFFCFFDPYRTVHTIDHVARTLNGGIRVHRWGVPLAATTSLKPHTTHLCSDPSALPSFVPSSWIASSSSLASRTLKKSPDMEPPVAVFVCDLDGRWMTILLADARCYISRSRWREIKPCMHYGLACLVTASAWPMHTPAQGAYLLPPICLCSWLEMARIPLLLLFDPWVQCVVSFVALLASLDQTIRNSWWRGQHTCCLHWSGAALRSFMIWWWAQSGEKEKGKQEKHGRRRQQDNNNNNAVLTELYIQPFDICFQMFIRTPVG